MNSAIVTDSTCDIPYDLAAEYNIHIVPNILVIDGKNIEDNQDFSRQDFYARLPQMTTFPTTSTASPGRYTALYEQLLLKGHDQIISIHASKFLSGIYNTAVLAAEAFTGRVQVIDSQHVSLGLGFQVIEAAEALVAGLPVDAILNMLAPLHRSVHVIAMLDTLEYVRRSGRVSWARASLGSLLNIKPFVEVKGGNVHRLGDTRTRKKGITRLIELVQGLGQLRRLAILHTNAETDARMILKEINPQLPNPPLVVNVTTVIGTHVGPNGLGIAALTAQ